MSTQADFMLRGRNPDVLTCIANLSNDEVFTPPEFANRMLDTLAEAWAADRDGANLWADKTVKFLDPCTKSGVFLREITSRLTKGLAVEIPSLDERVNHILTKQVFGIGITYLTSLLARRSAYCSKDAQGKYSIAKSFDSDSGNIWFDRTEHTWVNGRCKYCGANQGSYDRGEERETHAYAFIHTNDIEARIGELFGGDMQSTSLWGTPRTSLALTGEPAICRSINTSLSKRRSSNRDTLRWSFLRGGWPLASASASSAGQCSGTVASAHLSIIRRQTRYFRVSRSRQGSATSSGMRPTTAIAW